MHDMPGMRLPTAISTTKASELAAGAVAWLLMVGAMMLPALVPRIRRVASRGIGRIRQRAIAQTLFGAVLVWIVFGVIVVTPTTVLPTTDNRASGVFMAVWLAVAAWQFTPIKRRSLRECHRVPVPPGVADGLPRVRAGAEHAIWCSVSCAPAMMAMAFTGHALLPMAVATIGFTMELVVHRPQLAARATAVGIVGAALLSTMLAVTG
jgi:predicted metal-binding membrane protein